MIKNILCTIILCAAASILESTVLFRIAFIKGVIPDISLCILVYSAYVNGAMTGQVSGFFSGLLRDFLSSAPLGLNCLVRTIIGAVTGVFKGSFFLDFFLLPVILCIIATILKALLYLVLHFVLGPKVPYYSFTSSLFWIETGLNAVSAPVLFFLLKKIKYLSPARR